MANIIDYILWRGDLTMEKSEFNIIDALIFTQISYLDFEGIVSRDFKEKIKIKDACELYKTMRDKKLGIIIPKEIEGVFSAMAQSLRYKDLLLSGYVNKVDRNSEMQFSAICISMKDNVFVSYRGTDDTIVGWKEDFNLGFMQAVPSQIEARKYLEESIKKSIKAPFYVGGHSKGGNLAIYAFSNIKKQYKKRILKVYNFDGPGFLEEVIKRDEYVEGTEKIINVLPKLSLVGQLLNRIGEDEIVESDGNILTQHRAFSWHIQGVDFVKASSFNESSVMVDNVITKWISEMDYEERENLIENLFEVFAISDVHTLTDMADKIKFIKLIGNADKNKMMQLKKNLSRIIEYAAKAVGRKGE